MERSPADHSFGDEGKEPFDLVQPGTACRGEMEAESLPLQPTLHLGAFVGAVVVHDEMHFLIGRELFFEMIQKPHELPAAVALLTGADDFAVENIERSLQGELESYFSLDLSDVRLHPQALGDIFILDGASGPFRSVMRSRCRLMK